MATMRGEIPHDDRTDDQLVAATLAGDPQAFGVLVGRHDRYVRYAIARYFGPRAEDEDDLAQEVFMRAFARLPTYRPEGKFGGWLATLAAHHCIDQLRRHRRNQFAASVLELLPNRPDRAPGPEAEALRADLGEALAAALGQITPAQRGAVVLCCGQGLSYGEAAATLGIEKTALRMRLHTGRHKLRAMLAAV